MQGLGPLGPGITAFDHIGEELVAELDVLGVLLGRDE